MSEPTPRSSAVTSSPSSGDAGPDSSPDPTLGRLVNDLTTQVPDLIRSELRLAQAELSEKGKQVGVGIGAFGAAGVVALYGVGALVATAIIALALVVDLWLSALIVTAVLFVVAGVLALVGRGKVQQGTPLTPERTQRSVQEDIATVKGQRS